MDQTRRSMHTRSVARSQEVVDAAGATVQRVPLPGDLRWNGEEWRRYDGLRWKGATASVRPDRLRNPARFTDEDAISPERQERALALAVEDQVAQYGAHVVFEGPTGTIIGFRRKVSHVLHAVLTVLTSGLWAIVW